MPEYLSKLFAARRPLDPIPAMPRPKYAPVSALQDEHRSLEQIFSEAKARHVANDDGDFGRNKVRETKEEKQLRVKKEQVAKSQEQIKVQLKNCK